MNWIVLIDGRLFALAFTVGVVALAVGTWLVLAAMDRHAARRKLSAQQDFVWARATRFMELGDTASMALLITKHGREMSTRQRRLVDAWMQEKAHDNDH